MTSKHLLFFCLVCAMACGVGQVFISDIPNRGVVAFWDNLFTLAAVVAAIFYAKDRNREQT